MIKDSFSFKAIARELGRDCTSISKEIKHHITLKRTGCYGKSFNNCVHRFACKRSYICDSPSCQTRYCRFCLKCSEVCSDYKEYLCPMPLKPPRIM
jgi:IS30 family transposase